jgi:hypothetical protein
MAVSLPILSDSLLWTDVSQRASLSEASVYTVAYLLHANLLSHRNSRCYVMHAPNNRTTGLCNPFLGNGSKNTPRYAHATIGRMFIARC